MVDGEVRGRERGSGGGKGGEGQRETFRLLISLYNQVGTEKKVTDPPPSLLPASSPTITCTKVSMERGREGEREGGIAITWITSVSRRRSKGVGAATAWRSASEPTSQLPVCSSKRTANSWNILSLPLEEDGGGGGGRWGGGRSGRSGGG